MKGLESEQTKPLFKAFKRETNAKKLVNQDPPPKKKDLVYCSY